MGFLTVARFRELVAEAMDPARNFRWLGREIVLPEYQRKIRYDKSRHRIIVKGRKMGITWLTALEAGADCLEKPGSEKVFISQRLEAASECIVTIRKLTGGDARRSGKVPIIDNVARLEMTNGSRIVAIPAKERAVRYTQGDLYISELPSIENDTELMDAAMPLILAGHRITIESTPKGQRGEFWKIYQDAIENPGKPWSLHVIPIFPKEQIPSIDFTKKFADQPHLTPLPPWVTLADLDAVVRDKKNPKTVGWIKQEFLCEFQSVTGTYFDPIMVKRCGMEIYPCRIRQNESYIATVDWGKSNDYSIYHIWRMNPRPIRLYFRKMWPLETSYDTIVNYIASDMFEKKIPIAYPDRGAGEGQNDSLKEKGIRIRGIFMTNQWKLDAASRIKGLLERDEIQIHPVFEETLRQLQFYQMKPTLHGNIRLEHMDGDHDDEVSATLLMTEGLPMASSIVLMKDPTETLSELGLW